jgi:hypothetical protein
MLSAKSKMQNEIREHEGREGREGRRGGSCEFHVSIVGGGESSCVASVGLRMVRLAVAGVLGSNAGGRQV